MRNNALIMSTPRVRALLDGIDRQHELTVRADQHFHAGMDLLVLERWCDVREHDEPGWPAAYAATAGEDGWAIAMDWKPAATMPDWASRISLRVLDARPADEADKVIISVQPRLSDTLGIDPPDEDYPAP